MCLIALLHVAVATDAVMMLICTSLLAVWALLVPTGMLGKSALALAWQSP